MDISAREKTVTALQDALGSLILTGNSIPKSCESDWSRHPPCCPLAVVRPKTTEQVSTVLRICHEHGCPVVPQGGMTGLAGGAIPTTGAVALSLDCFVDATCVDDASGTLSVTAGMTLEDVQQAAQNAGFRYPVDFGARGSCQIGGTIATNAGGQGVIRHGMTRKQVLGLEVVLADGRVLNLMNTMKKNNAGYDLKHYFIGSEGTLGIITRAVLQLAPGLGETETVLCALDHYSSAVALLRRLSQASLDLEAFEVMWQDFYAMSCSWRESSPPLPVDYPLYILCEIEADQECVLEAIEASLDTGEIVDAVVANSRAQAQELWAIREATAEFSTRLTPISFDVSLPISYIGDFVIEAKKAILARWPGCGIVNFGHIGDGNLHLTVDEKPLEFDNGARRQAIERIVYNLVGQWGGSISAEHGIGLTKRDFLHHSVSSETLAVMKNIKKSLDSRNILNPGKVLNIKKGRQSPEC